LYKALQASVSVRGGRKHLAAPPARGFHRQPRFFFPAAVCLRRITARGHYCRPRDMIIHCRP